MLFLFILKYIFCSSLILFNFGIISCVYIKIFTVYFKPTSSNSAGGLNSERFSFLGEILETILSLEFTGFFPEEFFFGIFLFLSRYEFFDYLKHICIKPLVKCNW